MSGLSELVYYHADVFSASPLSGNGLTVFLDSGRLSAEQMQQITQEMRQFESIFLQPTSLADRYSARIFTMEEELDFAGHPVLGAATVLHYHLMPAQERSRWSLDLPAKPVEVVVERMTEGYAATMDQGHASFGMTLDSTQAQSFAEALHLQPADLSPTLPLQCVSTGLPYLVVPVIRNIERAKIARADFEALLGTVGAKFVYVIDINSYEGRTWDNAGLVEDIATGSAAGPAGAYLVHHGIVDMGSTITLHQGRFVGRPSQLFVRVEGDGDSRVLVSGGVTLLARGQFL